LPKGLPSQRLEIFAKGEIMHSSNTSSPHPRRDQAADRPLGFTIPVSARPSPSRKYPPLRLYRLAPWRRHRARFGTGYRIKRLGSGQMSSSASLPMLSGTRSGPPTTGLNTWKSAKR
jgi:hypothetical protein